MNFSVSNIHHRGLYVNPSDRDLTTGIGRVRTTRFTPGTRRRRRFSSNLYGSGCGVGSGRKVTLGVR